MKQNVASKMIQKFAASVDFKLFQVEVILECITDITAVTSAVLFHSESKGVVSMPVKTLKHTNKQST